MCAALERLLARSSRHVARRFSTRRFGTHAAVCSKAPTSIGEFNVDFASPLGVGACGAVYSARHRQTSQEVAVKVMSPALPGRGESTPEEVADAIEQEGQAFAHVLQGGVHHPHVVDVMGCFTGASSEAQQLGLQVEEASPQDPVHYFVMERLQGQSLQDRITADGGFDEGRAKEVARAMCEGLAFLHEHGIAHRDVCPRNVHYPELGSDDDDVKIIDFSHAGVLPQEASRGAAYFDKKLGTAGFVAPEVLMERDPYSSKCDVYSLGCTVHAMLANGKLPRRHPRIGIMKCLPPTVSKQALAFMDAALSPSPDERPAIADIINDPWLQ